MRPLPSCPARPIGRPITRGTTVVDPRNYGDGEGVRAATVSLNSCSVSLSRPAVPLNNRPSGGEHV